MPATVYLVPSLLAEDAAASISPSVLSVLHECDVIFAESIRTTRRFFKAIDPSIIIDRFEWHEINNSDKEQPALFKRLLREEKQIAIVSEAGCPGVADPGQQLVEFAHQSGVRVKPLSGPSALLLALMASGMNGQRFSFFGYLPIDGPARNKALRNMEAQSQREGSTCIFIETPYRNKALFQAIRENCSGTTRICIAADLTGAQEFVRTLTVNEWKKQEPELHKRPVVYLLQAAEH